MDLVGASGKLRSWMTSKRKRRMNQGR
jgi:hypothetical protein